MTIIARKPAAKAAKPTKSSAKKPALKKAVEKAVSTAKKVAAAKKPVAKKAPAKKVAAQAAPKAKKIIAKKPASKAVATKAKKPLAAKTTKTVVQKAKPVAAKTVQPVAPKASKPVPPKVSSKPKGPVEQLLDLIKRSLDDGKAEDIVAIDMAGKSAVADYMVIATGRSQRQLGALAENLRARLKATGKRVPNAEGVTQGDWVLLDAGDVVVHLFRPEIRIAYNLEKMWSQPFEENNSGMEGMIKERQVQHNAAKASGPKGPAKPDFRKHGGKRPPRF